MGEVWLLRGLLDGGFVQGQQLVDGDFLVRHHARGASAHCAGGRRGLGRYVYFRRVYHDCCGDGLYFVHRVGVVRRGGDGADADGFCLAKLCFFHVVHAGAGGGGRVLAAFAPAANQRTQGEEAGGGDAGADFGHTEHGYGVRVCPEGHSGAADAVDEAESRHRHDAADAAEHENEDGGDLGLAVHLHGAKRKDGQECEEPVCCRVDCAVGVLNALHGSPADALGVVVAVVKVHWVAAAEDCEKEGCESKGCVDTYDHLHGDALPAFQQDAVECDRQRSLEEYVCQIVESELKSLVLQTC